LAVDAIGPELAVELLLVHVLRLVDLEQQRGGVADDIGTGLGREEEHARVAQAHGVVLAEGDGAEARLAEARPEPEHADAQLRPEGRRALDGVAAPAERRREQEQLDLRRQSFLPPWRAISTVIDRPRRSKTDRRIARPASHWYGRSRGMVSIVRAPLSGDQAQHELRHHGAGDDEDQPIDARPHLGDVALERAQPLGERLRRRRAGGAAPGVAARREAGECGGDAVSHRGHVPARVVRRASR
jgi:hypothetical protein